MYALLMTTISAEPARGSDSRRRGSAARVPDAKRTAPTITASVIVVPRSGSSRSRTQEDGEQSADRPPELVQRARGGLRFVR